MCPEFLPSYHPHRPPQPSIASPAGVVGINLAGPNWGILMDYRQFASIQPRVDALERQITASILNNNEEGMRDGFLNTAFLLGDEIGDLSFGEGLQAVAKDAKIRCRDLLMEWEWRKTGEGMFSDRKGCPYFNTWELILRGGRKVRGTPIRRRPQGLILWVDGEARMVPETAIESVKRLEWQELPVECRWRELTAPPLLERLDEKDLRMVLVAHLGVAQKAILDGDYSEAAKSIGVVLAQIPPANDCAYVEADRAS